MKKEALGLRQCHSTRCFRPAGDLSCSLQFQKKKERKLSSLFHCVLPRSEMLRLRLLRASAFSVFIPVQRLGPGERTPLSFGSRDVFCRSASSAIHRGISGNARTVTRSFLLANLFHSVYLFIPGTAILFGPLRFGKQNTLGGK